MLKRNDLFRRAAACTRQALSPQYPILTFPVVLLGLTLHGAVAMAQDETTEFGRDEDAIEEIVVTGSRIPRRDFNSTSPVTTVDKLELKLAGITNVEDTLNTLPQVVPSFNRTANNQGSNTATVNLRGLGEQRSLVLLNGRRFIPSGAFGSVDLNNIPSALVERIEVVSGGASAVYGSDALTGAINFILKDDFEGVEFGTQYDVTERGDGEVFDINLAGGLRFGGDRVYLSGFINYHDRVPLFHSDREFTRQFIQEDIFTGEVFPSGSRNTPAGAIPNPVDIGGIPAPDGITFNQDGTPRPFLDPEDRFNFAPFNYLQVPLQRSVVAAFLNFDLTSKSRIYGEYMFVDSKQAWELAPTLDARPVQMNIDNPFVAPETRQVLEDFFDPDGDGIAEFIFGKRLPELGSRNLERNTEMNRLVVGVGSDILNDWTFDLHVIVADSDAPELRSNMGSRSRFQQTLLVDPATMECFDPTGGCMPANVFGEGNISEAAADFIRTPAIEIDTDVSQSIIGSSVVGALAELPAGDLGFALGVEFRDDEYSQFTDTAVDFNDQMGTFPPKSVAGETELREVFAEVLVPILSDRAFARYLGLEAGYRYTDHSLAGGFDTWKLAAKWEPFTGYTLRSSVQQAVRAPNALEYFEAESSFINANIAEFADLCSASFQPDQLGITDVCIAQGIPASQIGVYEATPFFLTVATTGGNTELDPEISDTLTVGIIVQPESWPSFRLSLDYYSIEIDNAIQFVDPFNTVVLCFAVNIPDDPLCQAVMRGPANFNITEVTGGPRNIAKIRTRGYDLQVSYEHDLPTWLALSDSAASLRWWFLANHTVENGAQSTPDVDFIDCAGFIGFPCDINSFGTLPEYKTKTRMTYESGSLALSLQWLWIDSMEFAFFEHGLELFGIPKDSVNPFTPGAPSKSYFSLSFDYQINDSMEIYGGVNNLTDTQPPLLAGSQTQANTDASVYDVFGRRYYVGLRARFWD